MSGKGLFAGLLPALIIALVAPHSPARAEEPHGHETAEAPARLSLNAGKKWTTDAPLRQAMTNIRDAMAQALDPIDHGKFSRADYDALARKINGEVAYMVSNCHLEPKADAQLHLIIAQLLAGAEIMEGKIAKAKRKSGAVKVVVALRNYGKYFEHEGWQPLKH